MKNLGELFDRLSNLKNRSELAARDLDEIFYFAGYLETTLRTIEEKIRYVADKETMTLTTFRALTSCADSLEGTRSLSTAWREFYEGRDRLRELKDRETLAKTADLLSRANDEEDPLAEKEEEEPEANWKEVERTSEDDIEEARMRREAEDRVEEEDLRHRSRVGRYGETVPVWEKYETKIVDLVDEMSRENPPLDSCDAVTLLLDKAIDLCFYVSDSETDGRERILAIVEETVEKNATNWFAGGAM